MPSITTILMILALAVVVGFLSSLFQLSENWRKGLLIVAVLLAGIAVMLCWFAMGGK